MTRWLLIAALAAAPLPALAQEKAATSAAAQSGEDAPPKRVRSVLLYGNDSCPKPSSPDEIVVCAKAGDSPYRIPKEFRELPPGPGSVAWGTRARDIEEVNRATLPNSCSTIGAYGQSGCTQQMIQAWAAAKRAQAAEDSKVP